MHSRSLLIFTLLLLMLQTVRLSAQEFTSAYSKWGDKDCQWFDPPEGGDSYGVCKGPEGYEILVNYDFYGNEMLHIKGKDSDFQESLSPDHCGVTQHYGTTLDWRLADGKPFACIVRYHCYEEQEGGNPTQKVGELLLVKGLRGYEHIDTFVDVRAQAHANEKAHDLAEKGFAEKR